MTFAIFKDRFVGEGKRVTIESEIRRRSAASCNQLRDNSSETEKERRSCPSGAHDKLRARRSSGALAFGEIAERAEFLIALF